MNPRLGLIAALSLLAPLSAVPARADVPRCDPALEAARFVAVKADDVTARRAEHVRAVCAAQDASIARWSRVLADLHLDNTRMIAAANARNWPGVADALDHARPLLGQLLVEARADTARPHDPQHPVDSRLAGFVALAKRGTFIANATSQFFNTKDLETARYVSDSLGKATIEYETANRGKSGGSNMGGSGASVNRGKSTGAAQQFTGRELLTPDEVMREPRAIVLVAGEPPWLLDRINYLADPEYRGEFDANPYHAPRPHPPSVPA